MTFYAIQDLKTGLFFEWVTDCWYGTTTNSTPRFLETAMEEAVENLKKHFITGVRLINDKGDSVEIPFIDFNRPPMTDLDTARLKDKEAGIEPPQQEPVSNTPQVSRPKMMVKITLPSKK